MQGRLFPLQSYEAGDNMAIDQAIMEEVSHSGVPTLRFYGWKAPTLSLGYFQPHALSDEDFSDVSRVRRTTGGGAILHHRELTYSLTMPLRSTQTRARQELYREVHEVVGVVLRRHGIVAKPFREDPRLDGSDNAFLCFQRRTDEDLIVSGYKVLGSAQRRTKTAVLQHGSLLIRASEHASQLPGLTDLTSVVLSADELASEMASTLADRQPLSWKRQTIPDSVLESARRIARERFNATDWWARR